MLNERNIEIETIEKELKNLKRLEDKYWRLADENMDSKIYSCLESVYYDAVKKLENFMKNGYTFKKGE